MGWTGGELVTSPYGNDFALEVEAWNVVGVPRLGNTEVLVECLEMM